MTHVERSIEVEVPVRTAYDQWTQFEELEDAGGVGRGVDLDVCAEVAVVGGV